MSLGNNQAAAGREIGLIPSGTTEVYGIIGQPIVQVKTPGLYNRHFAGSGLDAVFIALDIDPDHVGAFFDTVRGIANFRGGFVTVPHKKGASLVMDELTDRAAALGAINAFKNDNGRLTGDMTDGVAFLYATRKRGLDPEGARVAMIGGGAAASAIAHASAEQGVAELVLSVRRQERHAELRRIVESVDRPPRLSFDLGSLDGFDLVINATSVGMEGDPAVPFPTDSLDRHSLVGEVVTLPRVTPWLAAALEKGCRVQYGVDMAMAQTQLVSPWWGLPVPDVEFN